MAVLFWCYSKSFFFSVTNFHFILIFDMLPKEMMIFFLLGKYFIYDESFVSATRRIRGRLVGLPYCVPGVAAQQRTLHKSSFTRYQKHTAMYNWSACSQDRHKVAGALRYNECNIFLPFHISPSPWKKILYPPPEGKLWKS